jgi:hypothetical protein
MVNIAKLRSNESYEKFYIFGSCNSSLSMCTTYQPLAFSGVVVHSVHHHVFAILVKNWLTRAIRHHHFGLEYLKAPVTNDKSLIA